MSKPQGLKSDSTSAAPTPEAKPTITGTLPTVVRIAPPRITTAVFELNGISPLAVCRFSIKSKADIADKQALGSRPTTNKKRAPKDFEQLFREAQYRSPEGWPGIHASCIRNAMISACRLVDFKMTLGKLSIFVVEDGYDAEDGTPLLRIHGEEPKIWVTNVRNETTIDLRSRPRWEPGQWTLKPRIEFDADQFTLSDVTNLIMRVGLQVGIGEGRPDSKRSNGMGFGRFDVSSVPMEKAA